MKGLTNGIDILPEDRIAFFKNLVKDISSDKEKVALIYKYLQQNFRYVGIQLGIGGYRPFPARFTDEKKYGDCKGLSFYTYSVLKALGIKSYVALINAEYNEEPVDPSFPCNYFNHMILCVPQKNDSLWLECTSKTSDFNYLGNSTENRYALLITEDGSILVPTPASDPSHNKISFSTLIKLNEDGSGQAISMLYVNGDRRRIMDEMLTSKDDDQKDFIVKSLGFREPDNFKLKKVDDEDIQINLDIEKIPQFTTGAKMFLNPRINGFWIKNLPSSKDRKQDFFFEFVVDRSDTTVYQLPPTFTIDALPRSVNKKCGFASYASDYFYDKEKNQLMSVAKFIIYKNRVPAAGYPEVKTFFDEVLSVESQKMVIKKN
ncbi:MAG: hypothetical protein H0X41_09850 [Chitinophagaceae bacterium]|nr:hypothetical protein [Chitinophagaceae bacterium]